MSAPDRQKKVEQLVKESNFDQDPFLNHFNITVEPTMPDVKARVIDPPRITYGQADPKSNSRYKIKIFLGFTRQFAGQSPNLVTRRAI